MSGLEWSLVGNAYLLVVILLSVAEGGWCCDELAALFGWPVAWPIATWKRWRRRCPVCKLHYHDRAAMLRHRASMHLPVPVAVDPTDQKAEK